MNTTLTLSVIAPIYNEERFLESCVASLLKQDFPADDMELLLVDGGSTDQTPRLLDRLQAQYPDMIRVLHNPKRIQSAAMNIGAAAAKGKYLIRVDVHAEYPECYFSKCIALLEKTGSENAGCAWKTDSKTKKGKTIAKLLTSPFGVGGAGFRTGAGSGYVNTVPFGTFRREFYQQIGGFDERLARAEDIEINYRIQKNGGKIYMTDEMHVTYYCRETVHALCKQAFSTGKWIVIAGKLCPGSVRIKYFVPLLFSLSLIFMPLLCFVHPLFRWGFTTELLLYVGLCLYFAWKKTRRLREVLSLAALFPTFHISYGAGSICGIFRVLAKKYD